MFKLSAVQFPETYADIRQPYIGKIPDIGYGKNQDDPSHDVSVP
jgi:hypothetical protein